MKNKIVHLSLSIASNCMVILAPVLSHGNYMFVATGCLIIGLILGIISLRLNKKNGDNKVTRNIGELGVFLNAIGLLFISIIILWIVVTF